MESGPEIEARSIGAERLAPGRVTLPIAAITLGLVWFGVTMLMLVLTAAIVDGFSIHGIVTLFWATVMVWVVNYVLDFVPGPWLEKRRNK